MWVANCAPSIAGRPGDWRTGGKGDSVNPDIQSNCEYRGYCSCKGSGNGRSIGHAYAATNGHAYAATNGHLYAATDGHVYAATNGHACAATDGHADRYVNTSATKDDTGCLRG
jgi:hypothetical protein